MGKNLAIEKRQEKEKTIVAVKGRLDSNTSPELKEALLEPLENVEEVWIDFTELAYISSAGLRVLLDAHKTMEEKSGKLVVAGANEEVNEVFTITGFSGILNMEQEV